MNPVQHNTNTPWNVTETKIAFNRQHCNMANSANRHYNMAKSAIITLSSIIVRGAGGRSEGAGKKWGSQSYLRGGCSAGAGRSGRSCAQCLRARRH